MKKSASDYTEIKTRLEYISKSIDKFSEWADRTDRSMDTNSNRITSLEQKVGIFATFQMLFSVMASALAGYLGINKK